MIGKLRSTVIDCRDPRELATFYAGVLGGSLHEEDETWVVLTDPAGRRLAFQLSPEHEPPQIPRPARFAAIPPRHRSRRRRHRRARSPRTGRNPGDRRRRGQPLPGVPRPGRSHLLPGVGSRRSAKVTKALQGTWRTLQVVLRKCGGTRFPRHREWSRGGERSGDIPQQAPRHSRAHPHRRPRAAVCQAPAEQGLSVRA